MNARAGVLLFAGTAEGRRLAEWLAPRARLTVCVATEYGRECLPPDLPAAVREGRLDEGGMVSLLQTGFSCAVDATHPYAALASQNLRAACGRAGVPYFRLRREEIPMPPGCVPVPDAAAAARYAAARPGNVLLTTGSKEAPLFAREAALRGRLFLRMLPLPDALRACLDAGIPAARICCMQGPFSREMNLALLREWDIRLLVTKESGKAGGFSEKIEAAREAGAQAVVIRRPPDPDGMDFPALCAALEREIL